MKGQRLFETYHGVYVNIEYKIDCDMPRPRMQKNLRQQIEFMVEIADAERAKVTLLRQTLLQQTLLQRSFADDWPWPPADSAATAVPHTGAEGASGVHDRPDLTAERREEAAGQVRPRYPGRQPHKLDLYSSSFTAFQCLFTVLSLPFTAVLLAPQHREVQDLRAA